MLPIQKINARNFSNFENYHKILELRSLSVWSQFSEIPYSSTSRSSSTRHESFELYEAFPPLFRTSLPTESATCTQACITCISDVMLKICFLFNVAFTTPGALKFMPTRSKSHREPSPTIYRCFRCIKKMQLFTILSDIFQV